MQSITAILVDGQNTDKAAERDYHVALEVRRAGDWLAQHCADIYFNTATAIWCFGDSTMWGATVGDLTTQSASAPPTVLQSTLRAYYGNTSCTVTNKAKSGTRISQMIDGTDGNGATFEDLIGASSAKIIYLNHCINSCASGDSPEDYKADLKEACRIVREAGMVMILCTPGPVLPYGDGEAWKCELLKTYVDMMRLVAIEEHVTLVDNYAWSLKMLASGRITALELIGDWAHPMNATYAAFGRNMAIPLLRPVGWMSAGQQYLYAAEDCVLASNVTVASAAPNSVAGISKITPNSGAQSIRFPVVIADNDLDLYIAHPVWSSGASTVTLKIDGTSIATDYSMYGNDYGSLFLQDYETRIASQLVPGLHLIEITVTSGSAGLYYARVRPTLTPPESTLRGTPTIKTRKQWLQDVEFTSTGTADVLLLPEFPTSHFMDDLIIEFSAQLDKGSGIVICGGKAADNSVTAEAEANIIIGANTGTGYLTVWEGGGVDYDEIGAADLSAASHDFRVEITAGRFGEVSVYVDGVLIDNGVDAFSYELTKPYWGGCIGFWAAAAGSYTVEKLSLVNP